MCLTTISYRKPTQQQQPFENNNSYYDYFSILQSHIFRFSTFQANSRPTYRTKMRTNSRETMLAESGEKGQLRFENFLETLS